MTRSDMRMLRSVPTCADMSAPGAPSIRAFPAPGTLSVFPRSSASRSGALASDPRPYPVKPGCAHADARGGVASLWRLIEGGSTCGGPKKANRSALTPADHQGASPATRTSLCLPVALRRASWRSTRIDSIKGEPIAHVIYWPLSGAATPAAAPDLMTVSPQMQMLNIRKIGPRTMQTIHPLEQWILNRPSVRKHILRAFLEDQKLSELERTALEALGMSDQEVIEYRQREVAAESFKRNGNTRLTRDRFQAVGLRLVKARADEKVIPFPTQQSAG